jgi:hypothetical protein
MPVLRKAQYRLRTSLVRLVICSALCLVRPSSHKGHGIIISHRVYTSRGIIMGLFVLGTALRMLMSATCLHLAAVMSLPKSRYGPKHGSARSCIISRDGGRERARDGAERNLQGRTCECKWKSWKSGLASASPPSVSLEEFSLSTCVHLSVSFSPVFTSSAWIYRMAIGGKIQDKKTDFV